MWGLGGTVTFFSIPSPAFQTCRDVREMSGSKGRGGIGFTLGPGAQQGPWERWDLGWGHRESLQ